MIKEDPNQGMESKGMETSEELEVQPKTDLMRLKDNSYALLVFVSNDVKFPTESTAMWMVSSESFCLSLTLEIFLDICTV